MKESKDAAEMNKRLAELVAKDWNEISLARLLGDVADTIPQHGSTSFQPNCFQNLSHCSTAAAAGQDVWSTKEVELEERLENKDINRSQYSKERKEIERKRSSAEEHEQVKKRRKEDVVENLNGVEAKPGEMFSQGEAEKKLLSIVGAGDSDNVLKLMSSLSQSFDFASCSTNESRCDIPKDSLLELASLEESFVGMTRMYPSPYSGSSSCGGGGGGGGGGVVELRFETASVEEEEQQRGEARLKEQLAKDGDLEKYIRGKEKLLDELKQKAREPGDLMDGGSEGELEADQREEAQLKAQLARDGDFERYQREKRKYRELRQKRTDDIEISSPFKNLGVKVLEGKEVENYSGLTEVEKVQKEVACAKEKLSKEKDVQEYKRERKVIFRRALERLRKQLLKDGNMKSYLAEKELIDGINC